jgi:MoxR-like ATPase
MTADLARLAEKIRAEVTRVVVGQDALVELMLLTLTARGHILLEGVPGLAKSLAVETFARAVGGDFHRFQFTPDKLPGDITGTTVYNADRCGFDYHPGPVFCNLFLADEINRASPKVQSALLQAMQERSVDADGKSRPLPEPFMVLATQNPVEQSGTYPLSEAQTDRFAVKFPVDYPDEAAELILLERKHTDFEARKASVSAVADLETIRELQRAAREEIAAGETLCRYILRLCRATRPDSGGPDGEALAEFHPFIRLGASPRAGESLLALAKARALCQGRDAVDFADVEFCAPHVFRHRLLLDFSAAAEGITAEVVIERLLDRVPAW